MTEVLAALLGTIVGGFISWIANVYQNKSQATFDFHREFDSDVMHRSRILADQLIRKNPNDTLYEIYEKYPEESFHIWQVINFYRRLWVAINYGQVKTNLVPELFGEIFIWWYLLCFEKQYIPAYNHSQGRKQILELKKWIDKHSNKSEMDEWTRLALKKREQRISKK
ncbi:hypothetical protein VB780_05255 [Leptolyngbya sp. CCNP1308]|uniref:hypothetical protein n=1 Tax=Leptolyngbya sp. CCNP1308 TaxID=3110255 RepID=UPI002B20F4EC|nr:hypothetical protein [Leptolyngbya sp. CCNP1308]MEA5447966.1 hypothetical protein [Leptolyngbya sp. CCNP1308]